MYKIKEHPDKYSSCFTFSHLGCLGFFPTLAVQVFLTLAVQVHSDPANRWCAAGLSPFARCPANATKTSWQGVFKICRLPLVVRALEGGGEVFHLAASSYVQLLPQGLLSRAFRPILMCLPFVLFHQFCDHHNDRHLHAGKQIV